MKLQKALKLRKKLIGEISDLKVQIQTKNSYMEGSLDPQKFNTREMYDRLLKKIDELVSLKFAINQGNSEIQSLIYILSEYKGLISFWKSTPVGEGEHSISRYGESGVRKYHAQIDEVERDKMVEKFQKRVDAIQEEIDTYNYTTEISWGEEE